MALGVTAAEPIAELAAFGASRDADPSEVAELDRRYDRATGDAPVPHDRVVQWLRTWATPGFRRGGQ
jgi:hypothetical protein